MDTTFLDQPLLVDQTIQFASSHMPFINQFWVPCAQNTYQKFCPGRNYMYRTESLVWLICKKTNTSKEIYKDYNGWNSEAFTQDSFISSIWFKNHDLLKHRWYAQYISVMCNKTWLYYVFKHFLLFVWMFWKYSISPKTTAVCAFLSWWHEVQKLSKGVPSP